ncbi:hypothetical protein PRK78_001501 [Emydomyces testavorans]|uniref:Cation-transporting P-type ATPase N-terminal domain-containing protein n=1 Tax=Emydomyces testavorans TaxID=2070801 RepID=A0AAF0IGX7_9EURO|nr:hypothetical protein PRK78_001501 [Emydomyces testavorans]
MEDEKESGSHVHYADENGAQPNNPRRSLRHRSSAASSLSIRSVHSRVVAPEAVLPITYRTLSYNVEESLKKDSQTIIKGDADERIRGLSAEQAQRRVEEYGKNAPTPPRTEWIRKIMGYFFGGFGLLLFIGCILVFIAWKPLGDPPALANIALAISLALFF